MTTQTPEKVNETAPAQKTKKELKAEKKKRKKMGRKIKTLTPMNFIMPFIMKDRNDALNYFTGEVEIDRAEEYIAEKRKQGYTNFGLMHLFIAAYVRTVAEKPGLNRYVRGQQIYARNNIEISLTIKKEMTADSPDTAVKFRPSAAATAIEIYEQINETIENSKADTVTGLDKLMKVLRMLPRFVFRFVVWLLFVLDYWCLLPRWLTDLSPFHAGYFITSMGSLGIPPIYHHIYNFGTVPLFTSFGAKRRAYELQKDGTVREKKMIDFKIVMDERICDGFYYASALKRMMFYLRNPEKLDTPPKTVVEDIP